MTYHLSFECAHCGSEERERVRGLGARFIEFCACCGKSEMVAVETSSEQGTLMWLTGPRTGPRH
jgi:hypothetical protein